MHQKNTQIHYIHIVIYSVKSYIDLLWSVYVHMYLCVLTVALFSSSGPSSDSDLTSLAVDTDSLAGLDDGMASGRTSPNQPQGGATNISSSCSPRLPSLHERRTPSPAPIPASSAPNPEVSWPGRTPLFSGSLKKASGGNSKDVKSDYLDRASELIHLAVQKEKEQDFQAAFSCYRSGVDLLLQGVQGQLGESMFLLGQPSLV